MNVDKLETLKRYVLVAAISAAVAFIAVNMFKPLPHVVAQAAIELPCPSGFNSTTQTGNGATGGTRQIACVDRFGNMNFNVLNAQGSLAAITGTAANATAYTFSLPAMAPGSVFSIWSSVQHTTGTASSTALLSVGGVSVCPGIANATANAQFENLIRFYVVSNTNALAIGICNEIGVGGVSALISGNPVASITGLNFTAPQTVLVQFNVAATDQFTPLAFVVTQD